jgi:hypothetical protein
MKRLSILFFICFCTLTYAQSNENKSTFVLFDAVVGQHNLGINVGIKYSEKYKTFNRNHHFLFADKFQKGAVKYNNQMYYNVLMKYDTYEDNLILKINSKTEDFPIILNRELISFFKMNNKTFYNIKQGFYEILYQSNNIALIKKHFSEKNELKKNSLIYPNFTHEETLLILKNNEFISVRKKKYFHKIFPTKKKLINVFYRMNTAMKKKNNEAFILNLIKKLDNE